VITLAIKWANTLYDTAARASLALSLGGDPFASLLFHTLPLLLILIIAY